jgi:tryptophanyl-tRNA synthetase
MSLRYGTKKIPTSDVSDYSRINLTDDADTIAQKVRRVKTDPEPLPTEEKGLDVRPEADILVGIYAALAGRAPRPTCYAISAAGSSRASRTRWSSSVSRSSRRSRPR